MAALWQSLQDFFTEERLVSFAKMVGQSALIILTAWLAIRLVRKGLSRLRDKTGNHRNQTYIVLAQSVSRYVIYFIAILSILSVFGMSASAGSLLATAGVGGLILSFGLQGLIRDMVTGAFLLFEDQYRVGDYVTIGSLTGRVEQVAIRTTQLRGDSGELYTIPNGLVDKVVNYSRGPVDAVVDVTVAASRGYGEICTALAEALEAFGDDDARTLEPPRIKGIVAMTQTAVTVRIVCKCREKEHWAVERDLRAALLDAVLRNKLGTG